MYIGEIYKGKRHGQGLILTDLINNTFYGTFIKDSIHGYGIYQSNETN